MCKIIPFAFQIKAIEFQSNLTKIDFIYSPSRVKPLNIGGKNSKIQVQISELNTSRHGMSNRMCVKW